MQVILFAYLVRILQGSDIHDDRTGYMHLELGFLFLNLKIVNGKKYIIFSSCLSCELLFLHSKV